MKKLLIALALCSLFCIPALAQDTPAVEIFGGYQMLRHPGGDGYDSYILNGFLASVEGNLTPYFGVVGEFGYNRKSWDGATESFATYLFGPRFGYRAGNFRVFGHYLLGGSHYSYEISPELYESSGTANNFTQAIGGGVDISLGKHFAIRPAQIDMVSIKWSDLDGGWENHFRYSVGAVIKF